MLLQQQMHLLAKQMRLLGIKQTDEAFQSKFQHLFSSQRAVFKKKLKQPNNNKNVRVGRRSSGLSQQLFCFL